jgi:predicted enzyme involved in methoxymalonyl-ACP biosynthesis
MRFVDLIKSLKNSKHLCEICLKCYQVNNKKVFQIFDTFCLKKEDFKDFIE